MGAFEETTVTLADGSAAYARFWEVAQPCGAVLYHHGIQSHCGWYETSAQRLAEAGFAVLQVDRRGCGRNETGRGHAESADQLTQDALDARDELLRRTGLADYHVVGISWGGKLAAAAYMADPSGVRSLSLVTPGLFPRTGVSKTDMASIGFAMLYEQEKLFDIPLNRADFFTRDPQWQSFIKTDPLTLQQCTAGFYLASRRMDKPIARLGTCERVPIHLLLADDEQIIDNDATIDFVRKLNWPCSRITHYDNACHSLEFEGDPEVYFCDLVTFLKELG